MRVKLTTLVLMLSLMQVSATTFGQTITLKKNKATFEEVFREIIRQTGYDVVISNKSFNATSTIRADFNNAPLTEVLDAVVKGTNLRYTILENSITIKEAEASFLDRVVKALGRQDLDVRGRVTDVDGKPLPGASVKVKTTGRAVSADANGRFELKGIDEGTILVISFIGYMSKEVSASNAIVDIMLELSNSKLDEIQIIAYGTTTQRLSTGNVSTIKAADIEKQPVNNPLLALQGRVPGLFITQGTGVAGSTVNIQLRGLNSMRNGNDPFYVIDGIPYNSQLVQSKGAAVLGFPAANGQAGSPFSFLSADAIESITVLKDADATAIYGSRAANGAILITTKKGDPGDINVNVNAQNGWGNVTRKLNLLNTRQYLDMRHEALKNDGRQPSQTEYDLVAWDTTRYTDWQKELIGGTAQYSKINATISGGSISTQYIVGSSYQRETSVFPGKFSDQKGSVNLNLTTASNNKRFKAQFSGSYLSDDNRLPNGDLTQQAIVLAPVAPPLYTDDGDLNWAPLPNGSSTWANPLRVTKQLYKITSENITGSSVLSYSILPGLDILSSFGYNKLSQHEFIGYPSSSMNPEQKITDDRGATYGDSKVTSWIIEPQLKYSKNIWKGKLDFLLGTTFNQINKLGVYYFGGGYSSDLVLEDPKAATRITVDGSEASQYKYNALFSRLGYVAFNKYIINLTVRRDGSSNFGAENKFHNFGSISAGWIFSEEKAITNLLSFLSYGKIRGSYGTTGSDQIGNYGFLNLYNPITVNQPYQNGTALEPIKHTNPYLQWEETRKLEFGLDLGFLNDRILINASYYKNRSSNQLLDYALPIFTGFTSVNTNFPATIQNSGLEISLNTINIKGKDFNWSSGLNWSRGRNKLFSFPGIQESSYSGLTVGKPFNIRKVYQFAGVNQQNGGYQFYNKDGAITQSPSLETDFTYLDINPDFFGGLSNSIKYKGFQIDVLFQFVKQIGPNYYFGNNRPGRSFSGNQPISVLDRWQKPGEITSIQRYVYTSVLDKQYFAATYSDRYFSDASYIRLKNLSISWNLPSRWSKILKMQNSSIYIQGQNLLTITNYEGLDPETLSTKSLPPLKILTLGVKVGI